MRIFKGHNSPERIVELVSDSEYGKTSLGSGTESDKIEIGPDFGTGSRDPIDCNRPAFTDNLTTAMFANKFCDHLRNGTTRPDGGLGVCVEGILPTDLIMASVRARIPPAAALAVNPPQVWCLNTKYMRNEADWHNSAESGMCWVLAAEWRDEMLKLTNNVDCFVENGVRWMVAATRQLIDRHVFGKIEELERWPKHWKAHEHGEPGTKNHERKQRRRA